MPKGGVEISLLLGSYETVAFAASMAILWVIVVLHEVMVQL